MFDEIQLEWISKLLDRIGHSEFQSKMELGLRVEALIDKTGSVWRCLECGRCAEDSRAKGNLRRHVETHIGGICLPCNLCGHTSKSSNGLKQHTAKKHTQPKLFGLKSGSVESSHSQADQGRLERNSYQDLATNYPIGDNSPFGLNFGEGGHPHQADHSGISYLEERTPIAFNPDIQMLANIQPNLPPIKVQNEQQSNLRTQHSSRQGASIDVENMLTEAKYETETAHNSKVLQPSRMTMTSKQEVDARVKHLLEKHNDLWKCIECGKIGQLWHMRRHVEVHLTDLNFPCPYCGKVSRSSHGLYQHTAKQHPEAKLALRASARHKCSICGKGSKTSKGLSNHRWKYHRPGAQL